MDDEQDIEAEHTEPETGDLEGLLRHLARIQQESYREQRKLRLAVERLAKAVERLGKR